MSISGNPDIDRFKPYMLGALLLVGLALIYYFWLAPLSAERKRLEDETEKLLNQIREAERLLARETELRMNLEKNRQELTRAYQDILPTHSDAMLWFQERIYRPARLVGVSIASIAERRLTTPSWVTPRGDETPTRNLAPYGVVVNLTTGFNDLKQFVALLEEENPYVSLSQLTVSANPRAPEYHRIAVTFEWPRHLPGTAYPIEERVGSVINE